MTTPIPPFLSSSVYENRNSPISAGPAPGIDLIQEVDYGDFVWRPFSFYGLSGDDAPWANIAYTLGCQKYPNGINLHAIPGNYNLQSLVTVPQNPSPTVQNGSVCSLIGRSNGSTVFFCNAAGSGIFAHRTKGYGRQYLAPDQQELGRIEHFTVRGDNAPVNTIGLDVGDGWGLRVDAACSNFTATQTYTSNNGTFTPATAVPPVGFPIMFVSGAAPPGFTLGIVYYVFSVTPTTFTLSRTVGVGPAITNAGSASGSITGTVPFYWVNRTFWAEKQHVIMSLRHNSLAGLIDTQVPLNDVSHEYNIAKFFIFCDTNQDGIIIANGTNTGGMDINIMGNMDLTSSTTAGQPTNNVAALKLIGHSQNTPDNLSRLYDGRLCMKVEGNPGQGTGSVYPFALWADSFGYVRDMGWNFCHSLTPSALVALGQEFSVCGLQQDNSGQITITTPAMPGNNGIVENEFPYACAVYSSGGTGVVYTIGATAVPVSSGFIGIVASGANISPSYTTPPSWTWVPVGVVVAS